MLQHVQFRDFLQIRKINVTDTICTMKTVHRVQYNTIILLILPEGLFRINLQYVYVVVKFLIHVIFVFLLFFGMVMYANEVETKEK